MFKVDHLLYYYFEGCIFPSTQNISCGLEAPSLLPKLESIEQSIDRDVLQTSLDEYERYTNLEVTNPLYWKPKLIFQVLNTSSIESISFIPFNGTVKTILFVQKGIIEEGTVGFFAPYLSEKQQKEWNAQPELPNIHKILSEESIEQSLTGLDEKVAEDIKDCLQYFLIDRSTHTIILTYQNSAGETHSIGWQKA